MEPVGIFIFVALGAVIAGLGGLFYSQKTKVKNKLRGKRRVGIRDFNHGEIGKIVGNVKKYEQTLIAPLSKRECVYYQVLIQKKHDKGWSTVLKDEKCMDFLISDGIGTALIQAKNINGYLIQDLEMKSGFMNDAPERIEKYLRSKNKTSKSLLGFNKTMRYFEGVIHLGEQVAVKGKGEWEMLPDPDEQKLIMKGSPEIQLYISDDRSTFA